MSNVAIFEWTSRYGIFIDNEIAPLLQHEPLRFFARSSIKYHSLKKLLLDIEPLNEDLDTTSTLYASNMGGDCCICLEPFDAELVVTTCKHCFHSSCLLKFIDHAERQHNAIVSCPLCRSPILFLDILRDRAIIDFARAIESNLHATERYRRSFICHAHLRLQILAHEYASIPVLSRLLGGTRLRALRREAAALRDLLRAAALFDAAGREGLIALLREFDARCVGAGPAAAAAARRARSAASGFAAVSAPGGPIEAALAAIAALGLQLEPPSPLPALSVRPGQPSGQAAQPAPCSRWRVRSARGWRAGAAADVHPPPLPAFP